MSVPSISETVLPTPEAPTVAAPSGGLAYAIWSLLTPDHFDAVSPDELGVPYRPQRVSHGIAPLADVYLPAAPGPHPSVVLVHGGGFLIGSRRMKPMRYLAAQFTRAGFAVMVFDYRMIFRGGRIAAAVDDAETAVTWWHAQAERLNLDPARIHMMGMSAGATLTLLSASRLPAGLVNRLVSVFGVYDFTYLNGRLAGLLRRWLFQTADQAVWQRWSPVETATMTNPLLLVHGTADVMVPVGHAVRLAAKRNDAGLPVETVYIDGANHGFFNEASTLQHAETALQNIIPFLR